MGRPDGMKKHSPVPAAKAAIYDRARLSARHEDPELELRRTVEEREGAAGDEYGTAVLLTALDPRDKHGDDKR